MPTAISISELVKSFPSPGGGIATAVDHVSLAIEPGELFFLLGPSGCGKTTLLRMIAGFIEPTGGIIRFDEGQGPRDVTYTPPNKRNTGMVFQSYALWPHMTVEQNVAFGLELRNIPADERKRRVLEALAVVQMEPYAQRRPTQLSGGQQQRVALARALVIRPSVLLLDEPLSNLDAKLRNDLRSEIRRICKQSNLTTVYVTHDQKEALSMADRIAIMRSGKLVQMGPPAALYRRPADRFVAEFLGDTNFISASSSSPASAGSTTLETPAGRLVSSLPPPPNNATGRLLVSLRPEAVRIARAGSAAPNRLPATLVETVFLGETAQLTLRLAGDTLLRIAQLNPLATAPDALTPGAKLHIEVEPDDVVLLPA